MKPTISSYEKMLLSGALAMICCIGAYAAAVDDQAVHLWVFTALACTSTAVMNWYMWRNS